MQNGVIDIYNEEQDVPDFVYGSEWMGYDDPESFRAKAEWAREEGFGGGFVWTLDFDDFNGQCPGNTEDYPLTKAMVTVFLGGTPPTTATQRPATSGTTVTITQAPTMMPTQQPITTTPATSSGTFVCPGDGVYADPTSCSKFYQCVYGKAHSFSCPDGLHFNPTYKVCDYSTATHCTSKN